jgi:hypothetical protein
MLYFEKNQHRPTELTGATAPASFLFWQNNSSHFAMAML